MDDNVLRALHRNGHGISFIATFMLCAKCTVHRRARAMGLAFDSKHRWTQGEDDALRARYPNEPTADIARDIGLAISQVHHHAGRLGLKKSAAFFESDNAGRIQRGRSDPRLVATQFRKGSVPANKGIRRPGWAPGRMKETQFKKGRLASESSNYVPIGTERVTKDGYLERKMTDDPSIVSARRWVPVHHLVWREHRGPIPKGHVLTFRDKNKLNMDIDNLELITLTENMLRNTVHNLPPEVVKVVRLRGAIIRQINKRERTKNGTKD